MQQGALPTRQWVGGYKSGPLTGGVLICGRIGATAPTRSDGEISDRGQYMSRRGARECCLSRERLAPCSRGEAATSITASEPSRTEGGLGTGTVSVRRPATPPDRRSRLSAPSPDPGYRIREVETRRGEAEGDGAAEDRCKGTEYAWRINYKIGSRRSPPPRHLRGVCEEREGGFHLAVSHFT